MEFRLSSVSIFLQFISVYYLEAYLSLSLREFYEVVRVSFRLFAHSCAFILSTFHYIVRMTFTCSLDVQLTDKIFLSHFLSLKFTA